ncbi:MAG: peptidoglycan-binding domain-containing protein [Rhodomicrobiaceae bacterium]
MSRFTPLFLFLGLAAAVYLPQSRGEQDIVEVETANVVETAREEAGKERVEAARPIEPEQVEVAASTDRADEPLETFGPPIPASAASVPDHHAAEEIEDAAVAEAEEADSNAIIADSEQSEAGHISSAANADEIGPALHKLSVFDLKTSAQEQLARLGCYEARVDGIWGSQSRASLQAFNKRAGGDWTEPSVELLQALRAAPAALCERDCVADAAGGCAVANKSADPEEAVKESPVRSYLPPWMRGEELASTDPAGLRESASTARDEAVSEPRRRTVRRSYTRQAEERQGSRERRRTYRRNDDWTPRGWPGQ